MAETTADVRRDIEMTRERMSHTIAELERKLNVSRVVKDHPWPAIGLAFGAGFLLSGSGADMKAASATASAAASGVAATKGASSRLAPLLDDVVARMLNGITQVLHDRADELVDELKRALGAPPDRGSAGQRAAQSQPRPQQGFSGQSGRPGEHGDTRQQGDGRQQDAGSQPGGLDFQGRGGDGPANQPPQPHQQTGRHGTDPGQGYGYQPTSS